MDKSIVFLDIRTEKEYCSGHICDSILVKTSLPPLSERQVTILSNKLKNISDKLDKDKQVYVYCKKGIRAKIAVDILKKQGMKNIISLGGVERGKLKKTLDNNHIKLCTCSI